MAVQILKPHVLSKTPRVHLSTASFSFSFYSTTSPPPSDEPDPVSTVTSILTHHRSKSRWSTVLTLFPTGFTPSQFSQITLQLKNNPHLALRFFLFTQQKSLCNHDLSSYSTIIHILSRARLKTRAQKFIRVALRTPAMLIYKDLCRKNFKPQGSTVEALIGGLCDKGRVLEALEIMRVAMRQLGVCPTGQSYVFLIKSFCEERKMEEALKLQAEMVGKGFKPNLEIYDAFIDGYSREGNQEMVTALRKEALETQKELEGN
ncbi:hypothetical protein COLO4_17790 [Corchorus olitorius]|uniref:Uncharacterized protein n=1 Tax=Corchorus olitorius TaxID=93759 RepID=A0A1R3JBJ4_9ROSI|nr:hypothetical protein COLO4_17790 [Corchorus olitorius]